MKKYDLISNGYTSFDHIIKLDSPATVGRTSLVTNKDCGNPYWGGCSINISVGLSRLGKSVLPIINVGDDFETSGFKDFLNRENIGSEATRYIENETNPRSFLIQNPDGEHITNFYPGAMDESYFIPYEDNWFKNSKAALMTVGSRKDNEEFINKVIQYNLPLFFGMKGDFSAFPKEFLKKIFNESEVLFMNKTECNQIINLMKIDSIEEIFKTGKAKVIVITLGEKGSIYISKNGNKGEVKAAKVNKLVDTTGGGDGFITGFLYGYLNNYSYRECCEFGSIVSSFVLEENGCCTNLPDLRKFNKRYDEYKNRGDL